MTLSSKIQDDRGLLGETHKAKILDALRWVGEVAPARVTGIRVQVVNPKDPRCHIVIDTDDGRGSGAGAWMTIAETVAALNGFYNAWRHR